MLKCVLLHSCQLFPKAPVPTVPQCGSTLFLDLALVLLLFKMSSGRTEKKLRPPDPGRPPDPSRPLGKSRSATEAFSPPRMKQNAGTMIARTLLTAAAVSSVLPTTALRRDKESFVTRKLTKPVGVALGNNTVSRLVASTGSPSLYTALTSAATLAAPAADGDSHNQDIIDV